MEKGRIKTLESALWDDDYFTGLREDMIVHDCKLDGEYAHCFITVVKTPHKDNDKLTKYAVVLCRDKAVIGVYSWFEVTYVDYEEGDIDTINLLPEWLDCAADLGLVAEDRPVIAFLEQFWLDGSCTPELASKMNDYFKSTSNAKIALAAVMEDGEETILTNLGFSPIGTMDIFTLKL